MEEEKENIKKFSLQKFLESFISPFSNLKSAIDFGSDADNAAVSNYVKGFAMLYRQLEKVLESFGLEKIEPKKRCWIWFTFSQCLSCRRYFK